MPRRDSYRCHEARRQPLVGYAHVAGLRDQIERRCSAALLVDVVLGEASCHLVYDDSEEDKAAMGGDDKGVLVRNM